MKLSIIVPAYNEAEHIYNNLLQIDKIVSSFSNDYEIIAVNDGSLDNTFQEIIRASAECKHIVAGGYPINRGKGGAIKEGISMAGGDYIAFLDADLDLSPMHFKDFLATACSTKAAAVIGSKLHKDSKVVYPLTRKIISRGYYIFLKLLFKLDIKDTQTGVKLFDAQALKKIISYVKANGYAYDIEILSLIHEIGGKIVEMPVELIFTRKQSNRRINLSDVITMFIDTIAIKHRIRQFHKENIKTEENH